MNLHVCKHFDSISHTFIVPGMTCSQGIDPTTICELESPGGAFRLCCKKPEFYIQVFGTRLTPDQKAQMARWKPCPKFEAPTKEEIEQEEASLRECDRKLLAIAPMLKELKAKRPKDPRNVAGGEIECPICKAKARYTVSGYNGHIHYFCPTDGCVRVME